MMGFATIENFLTPDLSPRWGEGRRRYIPASSAEGP